MSFTQIAEEILAKAKRLDEFTSLKGLPAPTFDQDVLESLPADLEETRRILIDSTQTLKRLALGPVGASKDILFGVIAPLRDFCPEALRHFHHSNLRSIAANSRRCCRLQTF